MPDFGFDAISVTIKGADVYFFRDSQSSLSADFVEVFDVPSNLLAIVAMPDDATQLSAVWTDRGLVPPPVIAVKNAMDALGPILGRARAEMAAVSVRCAELQSALVGTRAEFEETRIAMHGLMRTLSHRYATKTNLVGATAPSPGKIVKLDASGALQQVYPVATESLTCLALHISEASLESAAVLKVVLGGAESGRVLGEWRVPGKAVTVGWNVFDLPMPVAAVRETVALEVSLSAARGSSVSFSFADEAAAGTQPSLAIRFWTAEPGGRFPYARHWIWNALGEVRLPAGTASLVTADVIEGIAARGRIESHGAIDERTSAAYLLYGGSSLLHLSELAVRDAEGICIELESRHGDLRAARFELVAQSAQHSFASGWRSFAFPDKTLRLGLSLPAVLPNVADLYLRIEDCDRRSDEVAAIELKRIEIVSGERISLNLGWDTAHVDPESLPQSARRRTAPRFGRLKAHNFSETEKFMLFEVTLIDLEFGGRIERAAKFKPSMANGRLSVEFRHGPNWPEIFRVWPGRQRDRFGDVFRITHIDDVLAISGELTTEFDRELIAALCRLMPTIIATGVQTLPNAAGGLQTWLDVAREFSTAAQRIFGEPP